MPDLVCLNSREFLYTGHFLPGKFFVLEYNITGEYLQQLIKVIFFVLLNIKEELFTNEKFQ